jgi:class 3 adenylate cyclase/tetratricopeptide (TPR) repeat protein
MRCSKCGAENPEGLKFCNECAAPLSRRCEKCGFENAPAAKFCGECAAPLTASTRPEPSQASASTVRVAAGADAEANVEGERKTVTALFADIKGSTELMEDLDPEEARAVIDPALHLMIEAVRRYDGYVVQSTGDGIFALFGAPAAYEDHPQRALYAALRLQDELKRYSDRMRQEGRLPLQARVGVNTGEVVVRTIETGDAHTEYTPIGHTANLAARMQVLAPIGSIAATEQVRKLCEGYFVFNGLGPTKVKGVSEPVNVFEVTGIGPLRTRLQRAVGRGLTKFVGREREMEALKHAAGLAQQGRGQIVAAMAEAGVGKSRLFFEFKATSQSGWMVLETFSVSHGKASAYLPVIDLLHSYFGIEAEDDARKRREKLAGRLVMLDPTLEDARPYLFGLLGVIEGDDPLAQMDGQIKKRRTLEAIKRILVRESLNQPLMIIFEDLHWIDSETQSLLNLIADSINTAKVLLLVNYRPEYQHEWGSKTCYTQLRLDPLGAESATEMLDTLLGTPAEVPELSPLKRLIIEKTDSNPFFMEETVQVLFDEGALVRNGGVRLIKELGALHIPPTVQAILASRIDRLPAEGKALLQTLAVMGKEFPLRLIQKVAAKPYEELERMLADLQLGEFIYEQPALPDTEYIFKHALTQEVAYNTVLSERRQTLHERIATAIESLFADQISDHLSALARHYGRSRNAAKAVQYLRAAGEQAEQRCAHEEAAAMLKSALEALPRLAPEGQASARTEVELRLALIGSISAGEGYAAPELGELIRRTLELTGAIGDPELHFSTLMFAWAFHQIRRDLPRAEEVSQKLIQLAARMGDPGSIAHSNFASGAVSLFQGKLSDAREKLEQAVAIEEAPARRGSPQDPRVAALSLLSPTLWFLGCPDSAIRRHEEAIARARHIGHPMSVAFALTYGTLLYLCLQAPEHALELAQEVCGLAEAHGFHYWDSLASTYRGIALSGLGQEKEGIAETLAGIDSYRATGSELGAAAVMVGLVASYFRSGQTDRALEVAERALTTVEQTGARLSKAELYRLKGEALLASGKPIDAHGCFERAIEIARKQSAKSWELRATMSLARLLRDTGRRDEARAMLADIYGWFTEGFDTADLKDAKELLIELGA